jgi:hypothetical protein
MANDKIGHALKIQRNHGVLLVGDGAPSSASLWENATTNYRPNHPLL